MISEQKGTRIFSLSMIQQIIKCIEKNLFEELSPAIIATHFFISESTLSSLFKIVCEMTIMEYIRYRRLSLAAEELATSTTPIIELAYKYGYETPEAFTKVFSRFHGFPPSFIRRGFFTSKLFLPIEIEITIQGGWRSIALTKSYCIGQDNTLSMDYDNFIINKVENHMDNQRLKYVINTSTMHYKQDWTTLYCLIKKRYQNQILFKIDD